MRKITKSIAHAFKDGVSKSINNTTTDGNAVYLHGNKIAEKTANGLKVTLAGWNTPTTRERVNGILRVMGFNSGFHQINFKAYLDGVQIDADSWIDFVFVK